MLFGGDDLTQKKAAALRTPPIPDVGWRPPADLPDLSSADVISIDTETREMDFDHGPGWARGQGHIVGFSIGAIRGRERYCGYFPLRHEIERDWNMDAGRVLPWLKAMLETPRIPKVGANLLYDIGWLTEERIYVEGDLLDVQFAEALIDSSAPTALEVLGRKYAGEGKASNDLYDWCAQAYGGEPNGKQRANIYRAPPRLVGPYAESDAALPLDVMAAQWPILVEEGLVDLFRMECASIPMLVRMRRAGVRIDVDAAHRLYDELGETIPRLYDELREMTGVRIDSVSAGRQVARVFDAVGVTYPYTEDGAPSFRKEWLAAQDHPAAQKVNEIREHSKIRSTFVKSYLIESHINGKLHCQFHPLRGDTNGTVTGRMASSSPNLQNISVRTKLGKKIRKLFIPFDGHLEWASFDYSQIEYRMLAHFAVGPGSDELRETYKQNPRTDYHDRVFQAFCRQTGLDYATMGKDEKAERRKPIKNINFSLLYGSSQKSLAYKSGMSTKDAEEFFATYHQSAPYVKPTMRAIASDVQRQGYIETILGRRTRFNLWEPTGYDKSTRPLPYRDALVAYGRDIKRAGDYKGVNYKLQGSAADVVKAGMLKAYRDGVFDVIGVPLVQVHDEIAHSVIDRSPQQQEAYRHLVHCMEHCVPLLRVPLAVDEERGPNWGSAK